MSTTCDTISNDTEGRLFDLYNEIDEFIYGKEPCMRDQLKLADFLIAMGETLYSDAELYGDVSLNMKYSIVKSNDVNETEYSIKKGNKTDG